MLAYIRGKIIGKGVNHLVVETGGLGYRIYVAVSLLLKSKQGEEIELFVFHRVREDSSELYGFALSGELEMFERLLSVSGVGPKMALALLGDLGEQKIAGAVERGDASLFRSVTGVGAKAAAKIVVELKGKITTGENLLPEDDETVEALLALGLKRAEILPYLKQIPPELKSVQEKVRFILKNVGKAK